LMRGHRDVIDLALVARIAYQLENK
jgi:hypothetical protein